MNSPDATVIGAWTTASKVEGTNITQVSRLSMPLVNEVVIGYKDKDRFNASEPKDDLQFVDYITHPTLPAILELLYGSAGVKAPTLFPRTDLLQVFATGVPGLNTNGAVGEMQRLNTSIAATPRAQQKNMGVLAGDLAGFPTGGVRVMTSSIWLCEWLWEHCSQPTMPRQVNSPSPMAQRSTPECSRSNFLT